MLTYFKSFRCLGALAVAATLLVGAKTASAQRVENAPELSEKVSSGIAPLSAMIEAKKWDDAIKTIDGLIAKTESPYDKAFLSGYKAQLVFGKGDPSGAIEPLENMLRLADQHGYFRFARALAVGEQDTLSTLSQLYMAEAAAPGKSKEAQLAAMNKARAYGKRLVSGPKVTSDAQFMWARILYSEATFDSGNVDMKLMKQTAEEAAKVLRLTITPKDEHYTLYLAALQQLGDNKAAAELLELLVKKFPNNKSYWPMLFQTYLALQASNDKDAELDAIVTLERAQSIGQMVSNRDNYQLAGLYYNMQQHQYAAELLETGLRNGKIDNDQRNWELLANCYQQLGKEARAIDTFLEAIKLFPKSASLHEMVGRIYYNTDKPELALKHFHAAVDIGLEKPAQTLVLISYLALELKRLEEALTAAQQAVKADPKNKEATGLLKLIEESVQEREKFKGTANQPKK